MKYCSSILFCIELINDETQKIQRDPIQLVVKRISGTESFKNNTMDAKAESFELYKAK